MTTPAYTEPVSRHLAVADIDRSVAFYRDVIGLNVGPIVNGVIADAACGKVFIQLQKGDRAYDSTLVERPRGEATVFLMTSDVAAQRDLIIARGGKVSALEKINYLKIEIFTITDPDGHTLMFGQSYHDPNVKLDENRQLRELLPHLPISDVAAGVKYYNEVLGFSTQHADATMGVLGRDGVTLLLIKRTPKHSGIGQCYAYVRNVDELYAELTAKGANVQGEPVSKPWGLREFLITDLEGNQIGFGQPFE